MEMPGLFGFLAGIFSFVFLFEPVTSIWLDAPDSVTIITGHPMMIDCKILDYKEEKVSWKNDDWERTHREHKQEMIDVEGEEKILRLTIDEVQSEDSGMYRCVVEGDLDERAVHADISTVVASGANVTEGFDANLKCKLTPDAAARILWHKDGVAVEQIASLKDRISLDEKNYSLTIQNAKLIDAGIYACEIQLIGSTEQTIIEKVVLQGKPYMVKMESPDEIFSVSDKSLILKCPVKGTPNPEVFWQRGDDVLEPSAKYTFQNVDDMTSLYLEISEPMKEDYGEYVCTAENVMGKVDVTFSVVNATLAEIPGGKSQASSGQGDRDAAQALWQPRTQFLSLLFVTIPVTLMKFC